MHWSTLKYTEVHWSTLQYSTLEYTNVKYSTLQYTTYSTVQYTEVDVSTQPPFTLWEDPKHLEYIRVDTSHTASFLYPSAPRRSCPSTPWWWRAPWGTPRWTSLSELGRWGKPRQWRQNLKIVTVSNLIVKLFKNFELIINF